MVVKKCASAGPRLIAENSESFWRETIEKALDGDPAAMRIVAERDMPVLKNARGIQSDGFFELLKINASLPDLNKEVMRAHAAGEIDADTALCLQQLIKNSKDIEQKLPDIGPVTVGDMSEALRSIALSLGFDLVQKDVRRLDS